MWPQLPVRRSTIRIWARCPFHRATFQPHHFMMSESRPVVVSTRPPLTRSSMEFWPPLIRKLMQFFGIANDGEVNVPVPESLDAASLLPRKPVTGDEFPRTGPAPNASPYTLQFE